MPTVSPGQDLSELTTRFGLSAHSLSRMTSLSWFANPSLFFFYLWTPSSLHPTGACAGAVCRNRTDQNHTVCHPNWAIVVQGRRQRLPAWEQATGRMEQQNLRLVQGSRRTHQCPTFHRSGPRTGPCRVIPPLSSRPNRARVSVALLHYQLHRN